MHIADGALSIVPLTAANVVGIAGTVYGLKRLPWERLPEAAMLGSAFFVASLIHVPVGPTSSHLVLNGLAGLLLGWAAFPVVLVGLTLQFFFFHFGGLTTLGANAFCIAAPGVFWGILGRSLIRSRSASSVGPVAAGFVAGFGGVLTSAALVATLLLWSDPALRLTATALFGIHLPLALAEGVVTALVVRFLLHADPALLGTVPCRTRSDPEANRFNRHEDST